jgi:hypothetical protein
MVAAGAYGNKKVWLVMEAGGGKRGGKHSNQPKEGCAGHMALKRKKQRRRKMGWRQHNGPSNAVFSVASQPCWPLDASTMSFLLACIWQHGGERWSASWNRHYGPWLEVIAAAGEQGGGRGESPITYLKEKNQYGKSTVDSTIF